MLNINYQVMQWLIYHKLYGGMVIYQEFLQQEYRAHTYLKTNQLYKYLFRNVTHPEIVHGMNLCLNVYKYMQNNALNT